MSPRALRLTPCESRLVPATVFWDGGPTGNGTDWADPANWKGDVLPGVNDQANLDSTGSNPAVVISSSIAVQSVAATRAITIVAGGTLSLPASNSYFGTVTVSGGQMDFGDGAIVSFASFQGDPLTIAAGRTVTWSHCTSTTVVTIVGTLVIPSEHTFQGVTTVAVGGRLMVMGADPSTTVHSNAGLTNHGTVELTSLESRKATLRIGGGDFLNAADGTLLVSSGAGGEREIVLTGNQAIVNQGKMQLSGASLSIVPSGGSGQSFMAAGNHVISPGRTLSVAVTTKLLGGAFSGGGTLSAGTLTLNGDATLSGLAAWAFKSLNGVGSVTVPVDVAVTLTGGGQVSAPVTNLGTWTAQGLSTVSAAFNNQPGALLRVAAVGAVAGNVTVSNATLTNHGVIELSGSAGSPASAALALNSGTFVNAADGSLKVLGTGAEVRTLSATGASTWTQLGAVSVNNARLDVVGLTLSNGGKLQAGPGANIVAKGLTNLAAGTVSGSGSISFTSFDGTGRVAPGSSPGVLSLSGPTVLDGPVAFELNGTVLGDDYDQVKISGAVTLNGAPEISFGYSAKVGDSFVIIDNDGTDNISGTFTNLKEGDSLKVGGTTLAISYTGGTGNDVVLTVTAVDTNAPAKVSGVVVNDGTAQRSRVTTLKVNFDQAVTLPANPADAFQLKRLSDDAVVALNVAGSGGSYTITFTGGAVDAGSLADGRYALTILAAQIPNFDGNGDGVAGDDYVLASAPAPDPPTNIWRLFGDNDGDADVDTSDFGAFRIVFGGAGSVFDFDNDGDVDASDFGQFRTRYGAVI